MDKLYKIAEDENIYIYEMDFRGRTKGLYIDNTIALKKGMTSVDTRCKLGEELGHHFTTAGNIIDQSKIENIKQERKARGWGYERLVPLTLLMEAIDYPCQSKTDLAEYLEVSEDYLIEALKYYTEKYGNYVRIKEYVLMFKPLALVKSFK